MKLDDVVIDLKAVEFGLPAISGPLSEVSALISSLGSKDRRKISRKIKKLCKKYINLYLGSSLQGSDRSAEKLKIESSLGFKQDKQLFNKRVLESRVAFVRSCILAEEKRKSVEKKLR